MRRKKDQRPGYGRLLDAWDPPESAGDPIGCLATTFTFSAQFFEEECLARFLGMESDPIEDGPVYLLEREEKLSQVACAAVLVDQHHCKGTRSLRWDLLSARLTGALLHAKVSVLCWTRRVRVIVASANLTEDGYRRNQEVFGTLDYHEGGEPPLACLEQLVDFLRKAAGYSQAAGTPASAALQRWNGLLDRVIRLSAEWGLDEERHQRSPIRVNAILAGPKRTDVLQSMSSIWPASSAPTSAEVISPFFDRPEVPNEPARQLWAVLRKRGDVEVEFHVTAEEVHGERDLFVHAPASLLEAEPKSRSGAFTHFYRLSEKCSKTQAHRPHHAKGIWLSDGRWALYMIGSSNFTSAGLGLTSRGNLEANLAYSVDGERYKREFDGLQAGFPEAESIDLEHVRWQPRVDPDEEACGKVVLPAGFATATYEWSREQGACICLIFDGRPPAGWALTVDDEADVFFDERAWVQQGKPIDVSLIWQNERPPTGFAVRWDGADAAAWWPVNIASAEALPPPKELKDLPLEVLIHILTSARPPYRVIGEYLRRKAADTAMSIQSSVLIDPHARVDTSGFLLQRTRRVGWALNGLRERLERPMPTIECLRSRLRGPIGVMAVAEAILREAQSPEEKAFVLAELALELHRVRPRTAAGCLSIEQVRTEVEGVIRDVSSSISIDALDNVDNLRQYVNRVREAVLQ